jgi:hypothetical protein
MTYAVGDKVIYAGAHTAAVTSGTVLTVDATVHYSIQWDNGYGKSTEPETSLEPVPATAIEVLQDEVAYLHDTVSVLIGLAFGAGHLSANGARELLGLRINPKGCACDPDQEHDHPGG